jgi:hypothetical protein
VAVERLRKPLAAASAAIALARMEPRQARSVQHLQNLYAVVVAIALTLAVERLLRSGQIEADKLLLFVALVATLIPFYHGTLRHLDDVYIERKELDRRETALLFDFFALFLESCILLGLAASITRPHFFAWTLLALLIVDITWATVTAEYFKTSDGILAHRDWVQVNSATAVLLFLLIATGLSDGWAFKALVMGLAVARTVADYALSWRFYAGIDDPSRRSDAEQGPGNGARRP